MDAHDEWRERRRRVSRVRGKEGRWIRLSLRQGRAPDPRGYRHRAVQGRGRHGEEGFHGLLDAPWADRAGTEWQMGKCPNDARPAARAHAVLFTHQGEGLQVVPSDHGATHQFIEQYDLRRCGWGYRLLPRELHPPA